MRRKMFERGTPIWSRRCEPGRRAALRTGMPAEKVAEVVLQALTAERPRTRYQVGREAKVLARLCRVLSDRAMDTVVRRALR